MRPLFALTFLASLTACGRSGLDDAVGGGAVAGGSAGAGVGAGKDASADAGVDVTAETVTRRRCVWQGFVAKEKHETGKGPVGIAVADLDGDGRPDLSVPNWGGVQGSLDGSVSVYLATGAGTFADQLMYPADIQPACIAAGDLTGDGRPELAVANNLGALDVYFNADRGKLKPLGRASIAPSVLGMAIADLDGDGRADLAAATDSQSITVSFGNGDGTFDERAKYVTGPMAFTILAVDVDGDGPLDLVVTSTVFAPANGGLPRALGDGDLKVLRNRGDGTFEVYVTYLAGKGTDSVAAGDVNGDGHLDLVAANSEDGTLSVLRNAGDGTFREALTLKTGKRPVRGVVLGDVDGDGDLDLVSMGAPLDDTESVQVFINVGDDTFLPPQMPPGPERPSAIAIADFDGDGLPDLAITSENGTVNVLLDDCR